MLLEKDTYIKSAAKLIKAERFRCCLTIANAIILLLILVISASIFFGIRRYSIKLLAIGTYSTLVLQVGCLLAWSWTLIRLYRDIKHSEKLLPNKHIFILHGTLLGSKLLLQGISLTIIHAKNHTENEDK